jgi:acyl-CoA oxidase
LKSEEKSQRQQKFPSKPIDRIALYALQGAKAHSFLFFLQCFMEAIMDTKDQATSSALKQLNDLFVASYLEKNLPILLENDIMRAEIGGAELIHQFLILKCSQVRQNALAFVDAFDLSDSIINSPFGRYDGNVYEHYLEATKKGKPPKTITPYWENLIRPILHAKM